MGRIVNETLSGAKWMFFQKCTMQPLTLVYGMVLARLLTPSEMGLTGLTSIFFAIASTLASSGLGMALIRKTDYSEVDADTMFWFNLAASFVFSGILFLMAPWFVSFFHQPDLLWMTRISAIIMFLNSTAGVHMALFSRVRNFRTPAITSMVGAIVGIPVCLILAYLGYGVWSLVTQGVVSSLIVLILVWRYSPWKPRLRFSGKSFRQLFSFGSKLAVSALLDTGFNNLRPFIIGKFYLPAQLAFYSKGQHLSYVAPITITGVLDNVTFPILSTLQHDNDRLCQTYRKYIRYSSLPIIWVCMTIAGVASPLVRVPYGEQWLAVIPYVQVLCFASCFWHICAINLNLLKVKGRSDLFLRLEIIKKCLSGVLLLYSATISVMAICWASLIVMQVSVYINCYYTGKLLGVTWWMQQKDYLPFILLSGAACLPAWLVATTSLHPLLQLALGGTCSFLLYFGTLYLSRNGALQDLLRIAASRISAPFAHKLLMRLIHD